MELISFKISDYLFQNSNLPNIDFLMYYVWDTKPQTTTQKSAFHTGKQLLEVELMYDAPNKNYAFRDLPAQLANMQDLILEKINQIHLS